MKRIVVLMLFVLVCVPCPSFAGEKEKIVLLPVSGHLTAVEKAKVEKHLAEGLGKRYAVIAGKKVEEALRQVLQAENQKAECDLEGCYVKIAQHFKAELIAVLLLAPRPDGGMEVTFRIHNVAEDREVYSKSAGCPACTVSKLIGLSEGFLQGLTAKP